MRWMPGSSYTWMAYPLSVESSTAPSPFQSQYHMVMSASPVAYESAPSNGTSTPGHTRYGAGSSTLTTGTGTAQGCPQLMPAAKFPVLSGPLVKTMVKHPVGFVSDAICTSPCNWSPLPCARMGAKVLSPSCTVIWDCASRSNTLHSIQMVVSGAVGHSVTISSSLAP